MTTVLLVNNPLVSPACCQDFHNDSQDWQGQEHHPGGGNTNIISYSQFHALRRENGNKYVFVKHTSYYIQL